MEIERKFLVQPRRLPDDLERFDSIPMRQGYIVSGPGVREVRLRREGKHRKLCIKSGSGVEREELEIDLSENQFEPLWRLTGGCRLSKHRYFIPWEGYTFELDVYEGMLEGLVIVEVEFDDSESCEAFTPPAWFGREVSDDVRYKNSRLASDGLPEET